MYMSCRFLLNTSISLVLSEFTISKVKESLMASEWSELYGEVVWAKCINFNWWPCYVYDPEKIPDSSVEARTKGAKLNGKQYVCYFYGASSYAFAFPKNIILYDDASIAKYISCRPKRYGEQFDAGIVLANAEVKLEKSKRVNFHLQGSGAGIPAQLKNKSAKSRKKKVGDGETEELYFTEDEQKALNATGNGKEDGEQESVGSRYQVRLCIF